MMYAERSIIWCLTICWRDVNSSFCQFIELICFHASEISLRSSHRSTRWIFSAVTTAPFFQGIPFSEKGGRQASLMVFMILPDFMGRTSGISRQSLRKKGLNYSKLTKLPKKGKAIAEVVKWILTNFLGNIFLRAVQLRGYPGIQPKGSAINHEYFQEPPVCRLYRGNKRA